MTYKRSKFVTSRPRDKSIILKEMSHSKIKFNDEISSVKIFNKDDPINEEKYKLVDSDDRDRSSSVTRDKRRSRDSIAILADRNILKEMNKGNIIIEPFNLDQLENCSYDVTLGENYYRNTNKTQKFINPWVKSHVIDYWGENNIAISATKEDYIALGLDIEDKYIMIQPLETILGHTIEYIGGKNFITTKMQAKSSLGRMNVTVCRCAGSGDVNFYNRWCMEISNFSSVPVILPIGKKIAQIIFYYTDYPKYVYRGKYQRTDDLDKMMKEWKPEDMLPKSYIDHTTKNIPFEKISPVIEIDDLNKANLPEKTLVSILSTPNPQKEKLRSRIESQLERSDHHLNDVPSHMIESFDEIIILDDPVERTDRMIDMVAETICLVTDKEELITNLKVKISELEEKLKRSEEKLKIAEKLNDELITNVESMTVKESTEMAKSKFNEKLVNELLLTNSESDKRIELLKKEIDDNKHNNEQINSLQSPAVEVKNVTVSKDEITIVEPLSVVNTTEPILIKSKETQENTSKNIPTVTIKTTIENSVFNSLVEVEIPDDKENSSSSSSDSESDNSSSSSSDSESDNCSTTDQQMNILENLGSSDFSLPPQ
jgi:dCTP deaminase